MNTNPVLQFREAVQASPALQSQIRSMAERGSFDPVEFASKLGFLFSRADLKATLDQLPGGLTDLELELMARQRRGAVPIRDLEPRGPIVGGAAASGKTTAQAYA